MKKILSICLLLSLLISCKKDKTNESNQGGIHPPITDPYKKPWNTKYITYTSVVGVHSAGYKIYYKDSLIRFDYENYGGYVILDSMIYDDSQLLFFRFSNGGNQTSVVHTNDGGSTWQVTNTGMRDLLKMNYVKKDLIYCFTYIPSLKYIYITGIGKSNLALHLDTLIKGRRYVKDLGTTVTDLDSTVVPVNDSVTFVINYK